MYKIVQYGSEACPACGALNVKLNQWLTTHKDVEYKYVNVKEEPAVAAQQGVFSVPALVVYRDDKEVDRRAGYFSLEEFLERVEELKERA